MRFIEAMQTCIFFKGYDRSLDTKGIGGAERDRTADPLLAKQVLSQLSYSPNHHKHLTYKPPGSGEPSSEPKMWARVDSNYRPHARSEEHTSELQSLMRI